MLPFVGLVPLALFVAGCAPDEAGRRSAVRGGLLFGAAYFAVLCHWILTALVWFSWWALPAWMAAVALLAGVGALVGWVLHRATFGAGAPLWLALPVAWTAGEWFRAHWPGPLSFPWLGLGTSLTGVPEAAGAAELVGARGLGFWLALVNGLLATAVLRGRGGPWRRWVAAAVVVTVVPVAWGVWRAGRLDVRDVARVALLQPGVPERVKRDPAVALDSTFASLDRLVPDVVPGSVDLVVLPEVVVGVYPELPSARPALDRLQAYAREVGAPVLFGALGIEGDPAGAYVPYNSAFVMDVGGLRDFRYDKRHLVPAVESGMLGPAADAFLPGSGGFGAGTDGPLAEAAGSGWGVLICYESSYPEAARRYRQDGADALVNITNDAWFGQEPWYTRSGALWQHPAHLVMRAIEGRVGAVRVANTGLSFVVDPVGRVSGALPLFGAGVSVATVRTADVDTLFVRVGDVVGTGAALGALALLLASLRGGAPVPGRPGGNRGRPSLDPSGEAG